MNFLDNIYKKSLEENERNLKFWQAYNDDLQALDFSVFSEKLTVPILVPLGNKILFRGFLKHTNEVTVSLGCDYFVKCSIKQAELLKQHRLTDAQSKLQSYKKEKEFLVTQLKINKCTHDSLGQDIIESCTEEEDKIWREKHRERVKQYKKNNEKEKYDNEMTDSDLWNRLEELELQEELEEEYLSMTNRNDDGDSYAPFVQMSKDNKKFLQDILQTEQNTWACQSSDIVKNYHENDLKISKPQLLEQVISRQKSLELKLTELKNKDKGNSKTEEDLLSKLDEIELLEELEDEIDRLDDILNDDSENLNVTTEEIPVPNSKKTVTFSDDDQNKTMEIYFKHSHVEPVTSPYNPNIGIKKPSDVYEAFPTSFTDDTTSILKKKIVSRKDENKNTVLTPDIGPRETIIVKDVLETADSDHKYNKQHRPVSLFKKRRQLQKYD